MDDRFQLFGSICQAVLTEGWGKHSPIEKVLLLGLFEWRQVEDFPFVGIAHQFEESPFFIDIALLTKASHRVALEADGHDWHEKDKEQIAHDRRRDRALQLRGWYVARFTGYEIHRSLDSVMKELIYIGRRLDWVQS
jgi:very-short-patch-repair endonuclease